MYLVPRHLAKATNADLEPGLGRILALAQCFLWPAAVDSRPGRTASALKVLANDLWPVTQQGNDLGPKLGLTLYSICSTIFVDHLQLSIGQ